MTTPRRTVDAEVFPVSPGPHKRVARRGWRRRGNAKARHEVCTDRFAWQKETGTDGTSAAERISKPWFWRRSFLPFFRRRKKGSRRRHGHNKAYNAGERIATTSVRWSRNDRFCHSEEQSDVGICFLCRAGSMCPAAGAVGARGGGVRAPRPTILHRAPCENPVIARAQRVRGNPFPPHTKAPERKRSGAACFFYNVLIPPWAFRVSPPQVRRAYQRFRRDAPGFPRAFPPWARQSLAWEWVRK